MFIFALTGVALRGLSLLRGDPGEVYGSAFLFAVLVFFLFYTGLSRIFEIFAGSIPAAFAPLLPALVLFFLVKDIESMPYLQAAVITAAGLRLFIFFVPFREKVVLAGDFLLTAAAVVLRFYFGAFYEDSGVETAIFVCLFVLMLSGLQYLIPERLGSPFPFSFFAVMAVIIMLIPAREEPINWKPVLEVGERIADGVETALSDVYYLTSGIFGKEGYVAGYSSLEESGGNISGKSKTELILRPKSQTYVLYKDKNTLQLMKRKRAVYLTGGKGIDKERVAEFLTFLYRSGVTEEMAETFSQKAGLDIEYAYVRTKDEIAPAFSIDLTTNGRNIRSGSSDSVHKKGYTINSIYLDVDYASPYYIALVKNAGSLPGTTISYGDISEYARKMYSFNLAAVVTEEEYERFSDPDHMYLINAEKYLDTTGCSDRLRELAETLTAGFDNDYDKCRVIEEYLRQYPYSTELSEGEAQDMTTSEGMSALAEEFLFHTGKGYCVHYASSMVMLLRLSGIPARCDAGYNYLYPFEEQEKFEVRGSRAHTWPEAFIKGAGWIPFEPTTAYVSYQDRSWNREMKEPASKEDVTYGEDYEGLWVPEIAELVPEMTENITEDDGDRGEVLRLVRIAVIVVFSVFLLYILVLLGTMFIREAMYRRASYGGKLRTDVELIKKDIRRHSGEFYDRGFLSDYADRAPGEFREAVSEIFRLYYRLEYGKNKEATLTEKDSLRVRDVRKQLHESYRKNKKKIS